MKDMYSPTGWENAVDCGNALNNEYPCTLKKTAPATPTAEQQATPKAAPGELSADSLRHQNKLLAETLGACILASGIVRKDIDGFTGPELLHFGEDLRSMLEVAPKQEAQEPAVDGSTKWFTVIYKDISPGDEARLLGEHPKASAMSWSHALHDRDAARASAESVNQNNLESLLELIDNFAETRHTCGHWTYNLKSNEVRQKVIAALKGEV